ncbi:MAG: GAF domain-containing protein [Chloroflexota bacterium]|nr:GAF domain-containing protein [Chloroflexota bacterium]
MGQKKSTIQRAGRNASLGVSLQGVMDGIEDKLFIIDKEYCVSFANLAMRQVLPESKPFIGKRCYEIFEGRNSPCRYPLWKCPLMKVLQSGDPTVIISPDPALNTETASNRYIKIILYPLKDNQGNINAIAELRKDVTVERELENQILRRHHHLHALNRISSATSGLWDLDAILNIALDTVLEIINATTGGVLLFHGQTQKLSYRVYRGLSAKYVEQMEMSLGEGVAGKVAETGESIVLENISRDPRAARPDLVSTEGLGGFISVPLKAKDRVLGVMNIASHVPGKFSADDMFLLNSIGYQLGTAIEQARLYQRLEMGKERYQTLLQHALTAQEEERKRIARELHDETSQAITSLTLNLQAVITKAETDGVEDADFIGKLRKIQSMAVHTQNEISKLMKELRPTLLDELGLPAAISRYAKDSLESLGTKVFTEFEGMEERLPTEVEVTLFRIAQGTVGNILEHAEAKKVSIRLECNASECILEVKDDGKGFDVNKITKVDKGGRGAGLFTMKERARLVGGACNIRSQPGKGTRIAVKIPLRGFMADAEDKSINS